MPSVVAIYSQMRPDAAAGQIAVMAPDAAAAILAKLSPRTASAILNEMDAQTAALPHQRHGRSAARKIRQRGEVVNPAQLLAFLVAPLVALGLAGCSTTGDTAGGGGSPELSLVGQGLTAQRTVIPAAFAEPEQKAPNSLWGHTNQGLFRDLRAYRIGDIVTVKIDINDKAQFDNQSGRSKEGSAKGSLRRQARLRRLRHPDAEGEAAGNFDASGSTEAKGAGSIDRSEKLTLLVAAVVTEVLPGGNLFISGSQEVRVNHEVRVLNIAGIVRALDIGSNNLIAYDKIAEARISYGGRGKLSDVQ